MTEQEILANIQELQGQLRRMREEQEARALEAEEEPPAAAGGAEMRVSREHCSRAVVGCSRAVCFLLFFSCTTVHTTQWLLLMTLKKMRVVNRRLFALY